MNCKSSVLSGTVGGDVKDVKAALTDESDVGRCSNLTCYAIKF